MDQNRKNPDQLLEIIRQEENKQKRGKLKIFFGAKFQVQISQSVKTL